MPASPVLAAEAAELDRCIDQFIATGSCKVVAPSEKSRAHIAGLMQVAAVLRALVRFISHPRAGQKARTWAAISKAAPLGPRRRARRRGRLEGSCARPHFRLSS